MTTMGLEQVKQKFLDIMSRHYISQCQGRGLSSERLSAVFQGNPGTGKTIVAELYGKFLQSLNTEEDCNWSQKTLSGIEIVTMGPDGITKEVESLCGNENERGVLIVDEAYQLISSYTGGQGRLALDVILNMMERNPGRLTVVFLGYKDEMESFFEHKPGLKSRIPYTIDFSDFEDYELMEIMCKIISNQWSGRMKVEGGPRGLYMRSVIRRIAAGRGNKGFGNARAVHNLLNFITQRQAHRLVKEKLHSQRPNYFFFTKEDLLGPDPSGVLQTNQAWSDLQNLVGLEQVKDSVRSLLNSISINYHRELHELRPISFCLNQVFIGEPGTGKTTVAKLYGRILADLGYLSRGDVVLKTPADFIGNALGASEMQTKQILEATVGRVLVIDEAYMLDPGKSDGNQDKFKTGVIDTIVSMVQGQPFEDRCIILIGYEDKIKTMFRNANPGLSRRFPIEQPFRFNNFTLEQLSEILQFKMKDQDLPYTNGALAAACEIFERDLIKGARTNVGIVDHALEMAKLNYSKRVSKTAFNPQNPCPALQAVDFASDLTKTAQINRSNEMHGQIDQEIIGKLEGYRKRHLKVKEGGINPATLSLIPTRFLFHGPPGTGKSTVARYMAELFCELGYLSAPEVIEYSTTDLVGQYLGQTSQKTREKLEDSVGRLVFIDDAHRLLNGGLYETQAIDELIQFLSQPRYRFSIAVVLAVDEESLDKLMTMWPDLPSTFSREIAFKDIPPQDCIALLDRELKGYGVESASKAPRDPNHYNKMEELFSDMQSIPGWANARDVKQLAIQVAGKFFEDDGIDTLQQSTLIISCMEEMITQKKTLHDHSGFQDWVSSQQKRESPSQGIPLSMEAKQSPPPPVSIAINTPPIPKYQLKKTPKECISEKHHDVPGTATEAIQEVADAIQPGAYQEETCAETKGETVVTREDGVSDAIWDQVQKAKAAADQEQARLKDLEEQRGNARDALVNGSELDKVRLRREYMAINAEYLKAKEALQEREKIQKALGKLGRCVYGYLWTPESGGYRCKGGSHFVSDAEVHRMMGARA
ncbi:P-loop containing nucleoside triphosphate hydrolase protein [Nemania sp. FL0031]|nr:P-loop containing nucleoside triphosphate hydrolase protein [Nemania sp. FL0031]